VVAAFFEELPEGKIRISLRSKDARVDVCKVCAQFGGGGHVLAAGARIPGTLAEVEDRVLAAIGREVDAAGL
jgi:bifunctional oligoribonuclease and PAP phosphatase NrnA